MLGGSQKFLIARKSLSTTAQTIYEETEGRQQHLSFAFALVQARPGYRASTSSADSPTVGRQQYQVAEALEPLSTRGPGPVWQTERGTECNWFARDASTPYLPSRAARRDKRCNSPASILNAESSVELLGTHVRLALEQASRRRCFLQTNQCVQTELEPLVHGIERSCRRNRET